ESDSDRPHGNAPRTARLGRPTPGSPVPGPGIVPRRPVGANEGSPLPAGRAALATRDHGPRSVGRIVPGRRWRAIDPPPEVVEDGAVGHVAVVIPELAVQPTGPLVVLAGDAPQVPGVRVIDMRLVFLALQGVGAAARPEDLARPRVEREPEIMTGGHDLVFI